MYQELLQYKTTLQKFTYNGLYLVYNIDEGHLSMTKIPTYNYNNDLVRYKYLEKLDKTPDYPDKSVLSAADKIMLRRNRSRFQESNSDKLKAATGSILGTVIPMLVMMKKQRVKNPMKLNYGLKEMIILSGTSIMGGIGLGMVGNDANTNWNKSREGVFQFMNAAIPTWLAAATLKWAETSKGLNNNFVKIFATLGAIFIGMHGSAAVSNIICDPKDKYPDRKLTFLDSLVNIDDMLGVLVLAKVPIIEKLHIDKLLPAIYTYCGYRAGKSN